MMIFEDWSKRSRLRRECGAPGLLMLLHLLVIILSASAPALGDAADLFADPSADPSADPNADPFSCQYNCSGDDPLSSLEELLRGEAQLLTGFSVLLDKTNKTTNETVIFLDSFEDLLRRQTQLYNGFESLLKRVWYNLDCDQQRIFLDSFEDLLRREVRLFSRFNSSMEESWDDLHRSEKVKLLGSFEDLLRRQTDLFKSFEDLYMMTIGGLTVEKNANRTCICKLGEAVEYRYAVKNWYNQTITNVSVVDDVLGIVAENVTLGPNEERIFYKTAHLDGPICNTARAYGQGPCGEMLFDESNTVCVILCLPSGNNSDRIVIGKQFTFTSGSDPPVALNQIEIEKNQRVESIRHNNTDSILLGDQKACSIASPISGGESSNTIRIIANQE